MPASGTTAFSLSGKCPHCGDNSVFISVAAFSDQSTGSGKLLVCQAMRCQGCQKFILGLAEYEQRTGLTYLEHFPVGMPDDAVAEEVPTAIADEFSEALRCFWVKSYKATVAMCRRAVQASCDDLKADGKDLFTQINDLAHKGAITEPLKKMAHRVRLTANQELHGKTDELAAFKESDAKAIIAFVREYFHHVYVMPALLASYDSSATEEPLATVTDES